MTNLELIFAPPEAEGLYREYVELLIQHQFAYDRYHEYQRHSQADKNVLTALMWGHCALGRLKSQMWGKVVAIVGNEDVLERMIELAQREANVEIDARKV